MGIFSIFGDLVEEVLDEIGDAAEAATGVDLDQDSEVGD
jgi:hypothetical protein